MKPCAEIVKAAPFPEKKYGIIYADPPWNYGDKRCNGNAESHYSTMRIADICALPVNEIAADNCILFLWTTYPMLRESLQVIDAWGFKYKSIGFQWIKQNRSGNGFFFGLGRWTRGNTEPCLIAVKGKPQRIGNSVSQLIIAPVGRHSKKPDIARDKIIELIGDLPRIELFARQTADGWDSWGNDPAVNGPRIDEDFSMWRAVDGGIVRPEITYSRSFTFASLPAFKKHLENI